MLSSNVVIEILISLIQSEYSHHEGEVQMKKHNSFKKSFQDKVSSVKCLLQRILITFYPLNLIEGRTQVKG